MPTGPGKYDDLCTLVRDQAEARAAIVIVIEGNRGTGFSLQTTDPNVIRALPELLQLVAHQIRESS